MEDETSLAVANQDLLRKAKSLDGGSRMQIPTPSSMSPNNKKEIIILDDGTEAEKAPAKGFVYSKYMGKDTTTGKKIYEKKWYGEELRAVILKVRWIIKTSDMKDPVQYISDEFDDFRHTIIVHDLKDRKTVYHHGSYAEAKEVFKIPGKDEFGKDKKSFSLIANLYIWDGKEIFNYAYKIGLNNQLFGYREAFGEDDTILAYETNFDLEWKIVGSNKFWAVNISRGKRVDLAESIAKAEQLNAYIKAKEIFFGGGEVPVEMENTATGVAEYSQPAPRDDYYQPAPEDDYMPEEEINVADIPF